jgi:hypothetical protein
MTLKQASLLLLLAGLAITVWPRARQRPALGLRSPPGERSRGKSKGDSEQR